MEDHVGHFPQQTLGAALTALQHDAVLTEALGDELTRTYLAVKRAEAAAMQEQDPERERSQVVYVY